MRRGRDCRGGESERELQRGRERTAEGREKCRGEEIIAEGRNNCREGEGETKKLKWLFNLNYF